MLELRIVRLRLSRIRDPKKRFDANLDVLRKFAKEWRDSADCEGHLVEADLGFRQRFASAVQKGTPTPLVSRRATASARARVPGDRLRHLGQTFFASGSLCSMRRVTSWRFFSA